ncbi:MAG: T9SS type A sorting domain-containing protein [Candidatus Kapabacteria bacterium]|nr:T9SS type A sorting domain-containing protein [Candidatus Kapabacteria bacterium]
MRYTSVAGNEETTSLPAFLLIHHQRRFTIAMKNLNILITLLIVFAMMPMASPAQTHIETNLTIQNEIGKGNTIRFGVDEKATDGLDTALGEVLLPNFHPPGGIHSAFRRTDNVGEYFTYKDFRPMQTSMKFLVEYDLTISPPSSRGDLVIFTWTYPLSYNIDSIVVTDRLDGAVYRFSLDSRGVDTMKNIALELFTVRCYYTRIPTSVAEEVQNTVLTTVFPNPSSDHITIQSPAPIVKAELMNVNGSLVRTAFEPSMNVSDVPVGIYILKVVANNGTVTCTKFIKD